ncbi:MAG: hypothetical protein K9I47_07440 [Bacteroidales bacterium]|nr:hypothetical protein [Bacteroidales bacterium]
MTKENKRNSDDERHCYEPIHNRLSRFIQSYNHTTIQPYIQSPINQLTIPRSRSLAASVVNLRVCNEKSGICELFQRFGKLLQTTRGLGTHRRRAPAGAPDIAYEKKNDYL